MPANKILTGAAAVVAAAGLIGTGAALSNAATTPSTSPTTGSYGTAPGGYGRPDGAANPHNDATVTGAELTKVTDAVKAKDSAVTVSSVRKDPDGSYDVFGTKAGAMVMLEVSKDLKTITTNTHGPGGPGGPRG